ncbi:MAG: SLC13 family permease [Pseudomonadota bacterium]
MVAVAVLIALGAVSVEDVMRVFSNPAPITIAAMFIISSSLVRTGALDAFAALVTQGAQRRPALTLAGFLVMVAALSAFMNNTPLVMLMIPVAVACVPVPAVVVAII